MKNFKRVIPVHSFKKKILTKTMRLHLRNSLWLNVINVKKKKNTL